MPYPDPDNKGAALASFTKLISPLPDPSRTLVMVMLPKKFRTRNFALQWALSFDKLAGPRIEVDVKAGKTLVEFRTPQLAQAAWGSPRLPLGDGREHVRVWWYHEIEEGEIGEEGEIVVPPPPVPRKDKVKPKTTLPGGQSSWQATPAKSHASLSSTNSKIVHGVHLMPLPPTTPTPFILPPRPDPSLRIDTATTSINPPLPSATSITFSVTGEESMDLGSDDGLDDSYDAPSILPPHSSITNVADISSTTLTCDTSNVSQTSSSSTAVSSPVLTSVVKTLPSELPEQKTAQAPVGQKEALLAKQRMSEEDIAQTKKEIAGKQAVDFSEPSPPKVVKDTQTTESALRQRIVDSMRNRQASNTLPRIHHCLLSRSPL
ncbi:hypothetical protein QCA50_011449 [Cerrena zonata]|uniref:Uncharacterized protein n=1 Tax=Cerrena zonata TaxID=2478898 RepID=A0AAW0FZP3_9APHY